MRIRALLIGFGTVLVLLTYSFPLWQPFVVQSPETVAIRFPGLPLNLQPAFANLPPDQQEAYLLMAASRPSDAVRMVLAALEPRIPLQEEDRELPELTAPEPLAAGRFTALDPVRWGQGRVTVFRDADGLHLLRFDDLNMLGGPDLRVAFSAAESPLTVEAAQAGEDAFLEVGPLLSPVGSQNYPLPDNFSLAPFRSVLIYSGSLNLVYTLAPLAIRQ